MLRGVISLKKFFFVLRLKNITEKSISPGIKTINSFKFKKYLEQTKFREKETFF
jgi:hypothetical protein